MTETQARLRLLLDEAPRTPDPGFVAQVDALVQLDQTYRLRRRRAWQRFAGDLATASAIIVPALGLTLAAAAGLTGTGHVAPIVAAMTLALAGWAATNRWASS